jgi:hypothetical protein
VIKALATTRKVFGLIGLAGLGVLEIALAVDEYLKLKSQRGPAVARASIAVGVVGYRDEGDIFSRVRILERDVRLIDQGQPLPDDDEPAQVRPGAPDPTGLGPCDPTYEALEETT